MTVCNILLNDGSDLLLNDGTSLVLLNECVTEAGGGGAGMGRSKQVGVSIYDRDPTIPGKKHLEPEWEFEISGILTIPSEHRFETIARFRYATKKRFSMAVEKFSIPSKQVEALARFKMPEVSMESAARFVQPIYSEFYSKANFVISEKLVDVKAKFSAKKLISVLEDYIHLLEDDKKPKKFMFKERHPAWQKLNSEVDAFTHSSSFVGQVIYDEEEMVMSIILSGKTYVFCGVPDRIFQGFKGADSKGAYFTRMIKGQFDC